MNTIDIPDLDINDKLYIAFGLFGTDYRVTGYLATLARDFLVLRDGEFVGMGNNHPFTEYKIPLYQCDAILTEKLLDSLVTL